MKKHTLKIISILLLMACSLAACGPDKEPIEPSQPLPEGELTVSHDPQPRNAVLEEYTGIHCQYCPIGHAYAEQLLEEHPGRASVISIHQGPFAANTYTTATGDAWAEEFEVTASYPAGIVNRHTFYYFPALHQDLWIRHSEEIMAQPSCLNLAARATLDRASRRLDVEVLGYYTASSATSENYLTVALLQNHILGEQTGASRNPSAIDAQGNYHHMHMLRDLLTPTWGDPVSPTVQGSDFRRHYSYTLPEQIDGVPVELEQLEVVAFVSESRSETITGLTVPITLK